MQSTPALGPTQTKVHHCPVSGNITDSRGLGGYQRLEVDNIQKKCFDKLRLQYIPFDDHNRFIGKNDLTLTKSQDFTLEGEAGEVVYKLFPESKARQILAGIMIEAKAGYAVQKIL